MATWTQAEEAIRARFQAQTTIPSLNWEAFNRPGPSHTPVVDPANPGTGVWARLSILPIPKASPPLVGANRPARMGLGAAAPSYYEGELVVEHFAPRGSGLQVLNAFVAETRSIFHRQEFGGVSCLDAEPPEPSGEDETGQWWSRSLTVPFYIVE